MCTNLSFGAKCQLCSIDFEFCRRLRSRNIRSLQRIGWQDQILWRRSLALRQQHIDDIQRHVNFALCMATYRSVSDDKRKGTSWTIDLLEFANDGFSKLLCVRKLLHGIAFTFCGRLQCNWSRQRILRRARQFVPIFSGPLPRHAFFKNFTRNVFPFAALEPDPIDIFHQFVLKGRFSVANAKHRQ